MKNKIHIPVLYKEVIENLNIKSNGVYVDATIGFGGHTSLILENLDNSGKVIGIDQDIEAIEYLLEKFIENNNLFLFNENFTKIDEMVKMASPEGVDGIIADFGVSSWQLDSGERGFSWREDYPLDMRMNRNKGKTAADYVNELDVNELQRIFKVYGEERHSGRVAREIVKVRTIDKIETTGQLANLVQKVIPKKEKIHPATRIFQALRIYVNKELESIEIFLENALKALKPGGRLCCISFHSLEDRIVKNFFREKSRTCICPPELFKCTCNHKSELKIISKKPITSNDNEIRENIRSRSAKMRVAEKI
ncbi:MAG: 16S rRNA (cytosine(1402)-N(4))-methyltransferase RsmH [Candidatus Muirbacterium halophilum]|nr:16S rRNA (cytosine(1402)-N(4))-methyltransferase RsmH [Candidatus Muirbacterium halophilum]MCK9475420.1 16S rRNA (cytosine(1402)-N(4))-methyltransferase RsmH [Candidatus Muirbacterium halophilum]